MRIINLLLSCALCCTACTSAVDNTSKTSRDSLPSDPSKVANATIRGLTKVGDLPQSDSPALAIQCASELICWLNTRMLLWQTTDGGKSWQQIYQAPNDEEILSYDFIDAESGWSFSFHQLYRTEDGGHTWTRQPSPFEYPNGEMRSVSFLKDEKTGWLAGGVFRAQNAEELKSGVPNNAKDVTGKRVLEEAIFRTSDGGRTWQRQFSSELWGRILQIHFLNATQGVALGERTVYYTVNDGTSWEKARFRKSCVRKEYLDEYYDARPDNVTMLDSKSWWISYNDGRIIRSADGGRSWCDVVQSDQIPFQEDAGQPRYFTKMYFENSDYGLGLGWDRFLYETNDGGSTWDRVSSELRFRSMAFPSAKYGVLISDNSFYSLSR